MRGVSGFLCTRCRVLEETSAEQNRTHGDNDDYDDDDDGNNNNNNNASRERIVPIHTRSFFTSELYACAWSDGYLGGGNLGGTGFRDENVGRRRGRLHAYRATTLQPTATARYVH